MKLPSPIKGDCVAVVLAEAYGAAATDNPQVGFVEFRATTQLDGVGPEALVERLNNAQTADAANALLTRYEQRGVAAVISSFDKLTAAAKLRAFDIIEGGACVQTSNFWWTACFDLPPHPRASCDAE